AVVRFMDRKRFGSSPPMHTAVENGHPVRFVEADRCVTARRRRCGRLHVGPDVLAGVVGPCFAESAKVDALLRSRIVDKAGVHERRWSRVAGSLVPLALSDVVDPGETRRFGILTERATAHRHRHHKLVDWIVNAAGHAGWPGLAQVPEVAGYR